jgi:hypothetical protein
VGVSLNGEPGVVFTSGGAVIQVVALCIDGGVRVVYITNNSDKLSRWSTAEVEWVSAFEHPAGRFAGRVDLGGRPPKSPTDPGAQSDHTRFVVSRGASRCPGRFAVSGASRCQSLFFGCQALRGVRFCSLYFAGLFSRGRQ